VPDLRTLIAALWVIVMYCAWGPTCGEAQLRRRNGSTGLSVGIRGGRDFENHAWSLGAHAGYQLQNRLEIRPSGDYYFGDETAFRWQLNADLVQSFGPQGSVYGGAGAAFTQVRALASVKTGYNLFFGLRLSRPAARRKLFTEFRWTFVNDTSPFRLVVGFSQPL
jgi:hypothetical protein